MEFQSVEGKDVIENERFLLQSHAAWVSLNEMTSCNPELKITSDQLESAVEKLKALLNRLHPDEMGGVVVGQGKAKQINLKPFKYGKVATVDESDFDAVSKFKWIVRKHGYTFYAFRRMPVGVNEKGWTKFKYQSLHSFIMGGPFVDHKDGDGLNNQRNNLRFATQQQNMRNMHRRKNTTGLPKGVMFHPVRNSYSVRIRIDKNPDGSEKRIRVRGFKSVRDATIAYDILAQRYFGEFATPARVNASQEEIERISEIIDNQKPSKTKHRFFGITYRAITNRWFAKIVVMEPDGYRRHRFLGSFKSDIEAATAYNKAAVEIFGEGAKLNKI